MANTTVFAWLNRPSLSGLTVKLRNRDGTGGVLNGAGDSFTDTGGIGYYTATVTEALAGTYEARVEDGTGNIVASGPTYLVDDTGSYELGDTGAGTGDWTASEKTAIKTILGVPASGTTPDAPTDGVLKDTYDLVSALSVGNGSGAYTIDDLVIKLQDGVTVVAGCDVIITTTNNSPSLNVHAAVTTLADGSVPAFKVDAGTYYIWRQKTGVTFSDPKTLTVASGGSYTIT